ncbi:MAG: THUMP domain-containing protein [Deferrisomatales bacterium]|nr:THUMP domain-containing protein [Deferrisomatales bacterium]
MSVRRAQRHTFFAACPPGLETVLFREVRDLRFARAEAQVGGVRFGGEEPEGWRAVLHLRCAVRVYRELAAFAAPTADALYAGARALGWGSVLTPDQTFAVDAKVSGPLHRHSGFAALKVKDAIADWFRERAGVRPWVDPRNPDARVLVRLIDDRCTLSLDLGGHSLHRRGYRVQVTEAPLGECLAAGAVLLSAWDRKSPFLDPLCGSGTLLIEAGLIAWGIAPGLLSEDFAFCRSRSFDRGRWEEMRHDARRQVRPPGRVILRGGDKSPEAVAAARRNAAAAGLGDTIRVEESDVADFSPTPGWGATVVTNPPYGVRLEDADRLVPLYETMGRVFKTRCRGFHVHVFLTSGRLARALSLRASRYWPLLNGGIRCRFTRFEIR